MRNLALVTAALAAVGLLAGAGPTAATPLVSYTDNTPNTGVSDFLSDEQANLAVSWTQSVAVTNLTVRALIAKTTAPVASGAWWITTAIGAGATAADVVASGSYAPSVFVDVFDFNPGVRTDLVTGLDLAAGTYFLVLDGPPGPGLSNARWIGGNGADTVQLAPGFSVGSSYRAVDPNIPNAFAPASAFTTDPVGTFLVFELDGVTGVPEPATWALMFAGVGLTGAMLRRRRATLATVWSSRY